MTAGGSGGPVDPTTLPSNAILTRRFGIWQTSGDQRKCRPIDNYRESLVNLTTSANETITIHQLRHHRCWDRLRNEGPPRGRAPSNALHEGVGPQEKHTNSCHCMRHLLMKASCVFTTRGLELQRSLDSTSFPLELVQASTGSAGSRPDYGSLVFRGSGCTGTRTLMISRQLSRNTHVP